MKKLLSFFAVLLLISCGKKGTQESPQEAPVYDSVYIGDTVSVEEFCRDTEKDILTQEEIAWWDSANANGGYLLVRGADRNLDTIVNHLHIIFTTEP